MPYLYKLYHVIEFDIYMYIHKYILPLPSRHLKIRVMDTTISLEVDTVWTFIKENGFCFLFFLFSTDTEHFAFLFNEFKLNWLMQEIQYTLYL